MFPSKQEKWFKSTKLARGLGFIMCYLCHQNTVRINAELKFQESTPTTLTLPSTTALHYWVTQF